ncbi:MAG: T9SS type A sorting domain-containing protein [Candidatus Latescibacteria bacterium]|nr:T9SS type A sorting domain-containing protein [Candidatus Latescibacterota bacterium]
MRTPRRLLVSLSLVVAGVLIPRAGAAQWQFNGNAISIAPSDQEVPVAICDGAGGVIVAWRDSRNGHYDVYMQRIDGGGAVQWTIDGVPVCTLTGDQYAAALDSDGAGGAIVSWHDARSGNFDIYAQRIDAAGAVQWALDGQSLCTATNHQWGPVVVVEGGSAIVAWRDTRSGNHDIYAQRIDDQGIVQWTANGEALCTAANNQWAPAIASDGAGGAIVTWFDFRSGNFDVYAQRIDAMGAVQWTADGVALCTAVDDQESPEIVADGAGGAFVAWHDGRGSTFDIYAQRVDASGAPQWTSDGVAVCTAPSHQWFPVLVPDGVGGVIVTWYDLRTGAYDIYAQRIDGSGVAQWTANGVAMCTAANNQWTPAIATDGAGGAIVTWHDFRAGTPDIYAQRVDGAGVVQWTANGVALCNAINDQETTTIATDGAGGAMVAWHDFRRNNGDIYAQRVTAAGDVLSAVRGPAGPLPFSVGEVAPNPTTGAAWIDIDMAVASQVRVDLFDVAGRMVRTISGAGVAGPVRIEWDGRDQRGRGLPSGVYFCRVTGSGATVTRKFVIAR